MSAVVFPLLIAQTPRAGRWNHLNLLPSGGSLPVGFKPADYLGAAAVRPVGGNFLAAVRVVPQVGTTKEGREVLALAGVRVPDGPQQAKVQRWLNERLTDLGTVVAGVDWAAHDGSDYRLPVLDEWREDAVNMFGLREHAGAVLSPIAEDADHSVKSGRWWGIAVVLLAAVVAAGLSIPRVRDAVAGFFAAPTPPPVQNEKPPPKLPNTKPVPDRASWERYQVMLEKVLGKPAANGPLDEKDKREKLEKQLREDLADAVSGVRAMDGTVWNKPQEFPTRSAEEQVTALLGAKVFERWLAPDRGRESFDSFLGELSGAHKRRVEDLVPGLRDGAGQVYRTLKRAERLRKFLLECKEIDLKAREITSDQRDALPLLGWLRDLKQDGRIQNPIPVVPFVTPGMSKPLAEVAEWINALSVGLKVEHDLTPEIDLIRSRGVEEALTACEAFVSFDRQLVPRKDWKSWAVGYSAAAQWESGRALRERVKNYFGANAAAP